ncbi:MAG: 30S ribosome-binding factor RbfA [Gammaproteobacteria bacterium]|nr:30S ribosome-binding factor RbfA [Gammaproteobacteria bacterium]
MPREFNRSERVAGTLRRELAQLIQLEVKDPEVGFIGLSDVEVSRDLAHAKVFITVFEPEKAVSSVKALNRAAGYLRSRLGQKMRIRSVPELHFEHDASVETGQRMDSLIDAAVESDRNDPGDLDLDGKE